MEPRLFQPGACPDDLVAPYIRRWREPAWSVVERPARVNPPGAVAMDMNDEPSQWAMERAESVLHPILNFDVRGPAWKLAVKIVAKSFDAVVKAEREACAALCTGDLSELLESAQNSVRHFATEHPMEYAEAWALATADRIGRNIISRGKEALDRPAQGQESVREKDQAT